jgi:hypothetical protein
MASFLFSPPWLARGIEAGNAGICRGFVTPDLNALWQDLGLTRGNGDPELDAFAPLAAIREAITAGRGTWRSAPAQCDCRGLLPFMFNRRRARASPAANIHVPQLD